MTQASDGQRRQEMLFALEEFKNNLWRHNMLDVGIERSFEELAMILMKGL